MNQISKIIFLLHLVILITVGEVCAQDVPPPSPQKNPSKNSEIMTNRLFNEDIHGLQNINDYKALLQSIDQQYPGSGLPEAREGLAQKLMGGGFSDKVSQPDYEQREEPVSVFADHVMQGTEKESIYAWGRVKVKYQDRTLWADKVKVNNKTGIGKAKGHVILVTADGTRMKARESLFNLKSEQAKLFNSKGIVADQFHITGKEMERLSPTRIIFKEATLTTCRGVLPDWSIEAKNADIVREDRVLLNEAVLKVKNFPILYLPFWYAPIDTQRKSGFMAPTFGWNYLDGITFQQQFFWAINRWSDATLNTRSIVGGWQHSLDYRYIPSNQERGYIRGNFFIDNVTGNTLWTLGMNHQQELPNDVKFTGVLDLASENSLNQIVNNNTQRRTRRNTDSYATINKIWDSSSLDILTRYRKSTDNIKDDTFGELPQITYKVQQTRIGKTPLYFNLETSAAWFVTDLKSKVDDDFFFKTSRLDFNPRLTLPLTLAPWLSITNTIGARETYYGRGLTTVISEFSKLPSFTRESINFGSVLEGPKFSKIFHIKNSSSKIKHLLKPRLSYNYTPDIDEEDKLKIKKFDGIDSAGAPANSVTYEFEQRLLKKFETDINKFETKQILRFNVSQSYNIREATIKKKSGEDRLPFSDLRFDLDSRPLDSIILNADATYNFETDQVKTVNFEAGIKPVDNFWIIMERRWIRDGTNFILGTLDLSFKPGWRVQYSTRFDGLTSTFRENNFSLLYDNPCRCWGFSFDIIDRQSRNINNRRQDQTQFLWSVKLRGLGELKRRGMGSFLHRGFEDTSFPETNFTSQ